MKSDDSSQNTCEFPRKSDDSSQTFLRNSQCSARKARFFYSPSTSSLSAAAMVRFAAYAGFQVQVPGRRYRHGHKLTSSSAPWMADDEGTIVCGVCGKFPACCLHATLTKTALRLQNDSETFRGFSDGFSKTFLDFPRRLW